MSDFAFYSHGLAAALFGILALLLMTGWRRRFQGTQLLVAVTGTTLWSLAATLHAGYGLVSLEVVWGSEVLRNILWMLFLLALLRPLAEGSEFYRRILVFVRIAVILLGALMLLALVQQPLGIKVFASGEVQRQFSLIGQLLYAVLGMALVEQIFRNTPADQRWGVKHLCFGLAGVFVYDFYLYTDALLFGRLSTDIWTARGAVQAMSVPLIAMTASRNPNWQLQVFISRQMVFHSATLFSAGVYMLLMALAGYYIKIYGGEWGAVLQITFLFGAFMVLAALLFSGQLRSRAKVFLDKHFFSYRYDYREEWLRLMSLLAGRDPEKPLDERVIWALSDIVDSTGGALWVRDDKGIYHCRGRFNYPLTELPDLSADQDMIHFLREQAWVINLDEYADDPQVYAGLRLPDWLEQLRDAWLVVPLLHDERLLGFVLLMRPRAPQTLNWENLDLLKTASMQAANYLALNQAAQALAEARQFEGFNRLSAFVIHDLKNLIAQLSLVARNAERHKRNPEFIDDAVYTIENVVAKMSRLMTQLKMADATGDRQPVDLIDLVNSVVEANRGAPPVPVFYTEVAAVTVEAGPDRLSSVIGHIIQNAKDATPADGSIDVRLRVSGDQAIVDVRDTGSGMDEEFIKNRLFRPFDSTKGLTGMGIGAYECREVIQALGGQVDVESEPDQGTAFRVMLPILQK